ncbi:MAG: nickel-type superoxide dismutase maturation protease [Acidimicrobiales bacterium]|nr:nickel-type superoxide dismutase maturation protease [Acidimicrobiales bacterium]
MPVLLMRLLDGLGRHDLTRGNRLRTTLRRRVPPAVVAVGTVVLLGAWRWRPTRVEVVGDSMVPALLAGDRLLVVARRPRRGDLVAVPDPREPSRLLIKRAVEVTAAAGVVVRGDNPGASTDSRDFGPVPASSVAGVAVYRYAPPDRVGWL